MTVPAIHTNPPNLPAPTPVAASAPAAQSGPDFASLLRHGNHAETERPAPRSAGRTPSAEKGTRSGSGHRDDKGDDAGAADAAGRRSAAVPTPAQRTAPDGSPATGDSAASSSTSGAAAPAPQHAGNPAAASSDILGPGAAPLATAATANTPAAPAPAASAAPATRIVAAGSDPVPLTADPAGTVYGGTPPVAPLAAPVPPSQIPGGDGRADPAPAAAREPQTPAQGAVPPVSVPAEASPAPAQEAQPPASRSPLEPPVPTAQATVPPAAADLAASAAAADIAAASPPATAAAAHPAASSPLLTDSVRFSIAGAIPAAAPRAAGASPAPRSGSAPALASGGARSPVTLAPTAAHPALPAVLQAQEQRSDDPAPSPRTPVNTGTPDTGQNSASESGSANAFQPSADTAPEPIAPAIEGAQPSLAQTANIHPGVAPEPAPTTIPAAAAPPPGADATPIAAGSTAAAPGATATPAGPATPATPGPTTPATLPAVQLALAITRNAGNGTQSFTLQLKPERLGTVDVKLELDEKGRATAHFVADRPDTLALLRQDAHHLVKSLNDAGVNADAGSLNFSLRDSGSTFSEAQERRGSAGQNLRNPGASSQSGAAADPVPPAYQTAGTTRLYDIRA
jgi:flagellar hook-length control protein FliK